MDTTYLHQRLLAREQELLAELSRFEGEARESRSAEVEDSIDAAVSSGNKAASFHEGTIAAEMLTQVRDALQRLRDGTYGRCVDCGRSIEPGRLEAVPWTPYCLADQERHDKAASNDVAARSATQS